MANHSGRFDCEGWWEQRGWGRQEMSPLTLSWDDEGQLLGDGEDAVGPFVLLGRSDEQGVRIVKQYVGRHAVDYLGTYDGEGTLRGTWRIGDDSGAWLIRIVRRADTEVAPIAEWP